MLKTKQTDLEINDELIMLLINQKKKISPEDLLAEDGAYFVHVLNFSVMLSSLIQTHSQFPEIFKLVEGKSYHFSVRGEHNT